MVCPKCRRDNPPDSTFCGGCGVGLGPTSPRHDPPTAPRPHTNTLAILSLCFGVVGMCVPLVGALAGLACGIAALIAIGKSAGRQTGQSMAIVGLVLSGMSLLVAPIWLAILLPVFVRSRTAAQQSACMSNQKQLSLAVLMYATDYDQRLPFRETWSDSLVAYTKTTQVLRCPMADPTASCSYGYNARLSGFLMAKAPQPSTVVSLFDAIPQGRAPSGGPELVHRRHPPGKFVASFLDGHVMVKSPGGDAPPHFVWEPTAGAL